MPRRRRKNSSEDSVCEDDVLISKKLNNSEIFDNGIECVTDSDHELDDDEYEVEKILKQRYNTKEKSNEYFVKWKGWPDKYNSWEPEGNLDCPDAMIEYRESSKYKLHVDLKKREEENRANYRSDSEDLDNFFENDSDWEGLGDFIDDEKLTANITRHASKQKKPTKKKFSDKPTQKIESRYGSNSQSKLVNQPSKIMKKVPSRKNNYKTQERNDLDSNLNRIDPECSQSRRRSDRLIKISNNPMKNNIFKDDLNNEDEIKIKSAPHLPSVSSDSGAEQSTSKKNASRESRLENVLIQRDSFFNIKLEPKDNDSHINAPIESIEYKVIDDEAENGFTRGWKLERVLAFNRRSLDGKSCAIVKFRGFKIPQQISCEAFKKADKKAFLDAYHNISKANNQ